MKRMPLFVMVLFLGCSYHPPHLITPQTRIGPDEEFGLRITEVTGRGIDYLLQRPAYVVAIRVTDSRHFSVMEPEFGHPRSNSGHHYVGPSGHWEDSYRYSRKYVPRRDPMHAYFVANRDQPRSGYWLLVASDLPISNSEIWHRLGALNPSDTSVVNLVSKIPQTLIASRTVHWAAYYAAFGSEDP